MDVSFIVPFHHWDEIIPRCIESIKKQNTSLQFEIILVDNTLLPNSPQIEGVEVVRCLKKGAASARNAGAQKAIGKYLALIDSDVVLDPDWLQIHYQEILKSPMLAAVQGPVVTAMLDDKNPSFLDQYRYAYKQDATNGTFVFMNSRNIILNTAACLVNKNAFIKVSAFEESLLRSEDLHLTLKFLGQGYFLSTVMTGKSFVYNTKTHLSFLAKYFRQGHDDRRIMQAIGRRNHLGLYPFKHPRWTFRLYRKICQFIYHLGLLTEGVPLGKLSFLPSQLYPMLGLSAQTRLIKGPNELIFANIMTQRLVTVPNDSFDWKFPLSLAPEQMAVLGELGMLYNPK